MKAKDLRERTTEHLKELEKQLNGEVFQARFKNFTNRLNDTATIRKTRRDLARIKTILTQRLVQAGAPASPAMCLSNTSVVKPPTKSAATVSVVAGAMAQPTLPSISRSISLFSSTEYSIGNWRARSLMNPLTERLIACPSVRPRCCM